MTDKTGPYPSDEEVDVVFESECATSVDGLSMYDFVRFGVDWERKRAASRSSGGTLTAEECEEVDWIIRAWADRLESQREDDPDSTDAAELRTLADRIRAGAQPSVGLTAEDYNELQRLVRNEIARLDRNRLLYWYLRSDAEAKMNALADRLSSITTSADRVLATYYGVDVVGPEGYDVRSGEHTEMLNHMVDDWAANGLRLTSIHVTPTTEGDDHG